MNLVMGKSYLKGKRHKYAKVLLEKVAIFFHCGIILWQKATLLYSAGFSCNLPDHRLIADVITWSGDCWSDIQVSSFQDKTNMSDSLQVGTLRMSGHCASAILETKENFKGFL